MGNNDDIPLLIPYQPGEFWEELRKIVREELMMSKKSAVGSSLLVPQGMTEKPLYRITEICQLFNISRTTVHDWVKAGRLRKIKVSSRVYFLGADIKKMFQ